MISSRAFEQNGYTDRWQTSPVPGLGSLISELKGTAWSCVSINAAVCASFIPKLFVSTIGSQARPRTATRPLSPAWQKRLKAKSPDVEQVLEHPLLDLFAQVNPIHNSFDLFELTQIYLETLGRAYWHIPRGPLGIPENIWILPAHLVTPRAVEYVSNLIDHYEYRTAKGLEKIAPEDVIFFRFPDPRDPYMGGLSPLRACWEQVTLASQYASFKIAKFENRAIPDAIVSPEEIIGEDERERIEQAWNAKFRRGGSGKIIVGESRLRVSLLEHSMGDLAALADMKANKEDIANAFHVPISYFTTETNLANLQAAQELHMSVAINPRLRRRDQTLNEMLLPIYDPSGRLFVSSEDPIPEHREYVLTQQRQDLELGVLTINEVRQERGLPAVPWGDTPQRRTAEESR